MLERWTTARSEGVAVETPPEKSRAARSAKTFFTFYSSFCQAKLRPGVLENYATKDSMIGIQKEQLFPRQFGKSSSFAIFSQAWKLMDTSPTLVTRDRSVMKSEPRGTFQQTCFLFQSHWYISRQLPQAQLAVSTGRMNCCKEMKIELHDC